MVKKNEFKISFIYYNHIIKKPGKGQHRKDGKEMVAKARGQKQQYIYIYIYI